MACVVLAVVGYASGLLRMGANKADRIVGKARRWAFAAGIIALLVALVPPLDVLAEHSFAAHMVQHLMLMLIAPPLLVWGRPGVAWLWALPLAARQAVGRAWASVPALRTIGGWATRPLPVYVLSSLALWFWHLPAPYGWAMSNEVVHAAEHFCFLATALAFWSVVFEPYGRRRLTYGATLLFVATFGMQNGLLGGLLTFAGRALYEPYAHSVGIWGFTPLEDQQLAGLIMWIPASLIHLSTLSALFVAWMRGSELRAQLSRSSIPVSVVQCVLIAPVIAVVLTGCDSDARTALWQVADAHPRQGPALMQKYGCGACHSVPGVRGARGNVGPPLGNFGNRLYVAGMLRNNPDNLVKWIRTPQSVVPGNVMPDLGVSEQDARDIAAYLYTLR